MKCTREEFNFSESGCLCQFIPSATNKQVLAFYLLGKFVNALKRASLHGDGSWTGMVNFFPW